MPCIAVRAASFSSTVCVLCVDDTIVARVGMIVKLLQLQRSVFGFCLLFGVLFFPRERERVCVYACVFATVVVLCSVTFNIVRFLMYELISSSESNNGEFSDSGASIPVVASLYLVLVVPSRCPSRCRSAWPPSVRSSFPSWFLLQSLIVLLAVTRHVVRVLAGGSGDGTSVPTTPRLRNLSVPRASSSASGVYACASLASLSSLSSTDWRGALVGLQPVTPLASCVRRTWAMLSSTRLGRRVHASACSTSTLGRTYRRCVCVRARVRERERG